MTSLFSRVLRKLVCNFNVPFPGVVFFQNHGKHIYLTFDDGPTSHTEKLLKLLESFDIKANFFVTGENIKTNSDILLRAIQAGHFIGNHTFSHAILPRVNVQKAISEIEGTQRIIDEYNDHKSKYFRPPRGLVGLRLYLWLVLKKYKLVLWSFDSLDSQNIDNDKIINRLINKTPLGGTYLFHDDSFKCIQVLEKVIPHWLDCGAEFKTFYSAVSAPEAKKEISE